MKLMSMMSMALLVSPAAFASIQCPVPGFYDFSVGNSDSASVLATVDQGDYGLQHGQLNEWAQSLGILPSGSYVDSVQLLIPSGRCSFSPAGDGDCDAGATDVLFRFTDGTSRHQEVGELAISVDHLTSPGSNGSGPYPAVSLDLSSAGSSVYSATAQAYQCTVNTGE